MYDPLDNGRLSRHPFKVEYWVRPPGGLLIITKTKVMSKKVENKKKEQLGMAQGTARNKLVKMIMFDMAKS